MAAGVASQQWSSSQLGRLAPLNQERWLGADLRVDPSSLDVWDSTYARSDFYQGPVASSIAASTKQRLINEWQEECNTAVGIVVQPEASATQSTGCSVTAELRCSEAFG